jgi:hypothetical protein
MKLGEEIELHFLGQRCHLGRADFIENDLEHRGSVQWSVFRRRVKPGH